jgi:hypothetical protein
LCKKAIIYLTQHSPSGLGHRSRGAREPPTFWP